MKTVAKKEKPRTASRASAKPVSSTKKTTERSGKLNTDKCGHSRHIEELKAKLGLILHPDFSKGDYYPRMDQGLMGQLPELISDTLAALEAKYPPKKR